MLAFNSIKPIIAIDLDAKKTVWGRVDPPSQIPLLHDPGTYYFIEFSSHTVPIPVDHHLK